MLNTIELRTDHPRASLALVKAWPEALVDHLAPGLPCCMLVSPEQEMLLGDAALCLLPKLRLLCELRVLRRSSSCPMKRCLAGAR